MSLALFAYQLEEKDEIDQNEFIIAIFHRKNGKQRENYCLIVEVAKITRNSNLLKII